MRTATSVPSLVQLETHHLVSLVKWSLRVVFLLGLIVALASQATAAPVVFTASGAFNEGQELSGNIAIYTATGKVSVDLKVAGFEGESFTTLPTVEKFEGLVRLVWPLPGSTAFDPLDLVLTLQGVHTLVGYAGGEIDSGDNRVLCTPTTASSPTSSGP